MLDFFSMEFSFRLTIAQLKVFSAICSNLVVIWLVAALATHDIIILVRDIVLAAVFCYLAVIAESRARKL